MKPWNLLLVASLSLLAKDENVKIITKDFHGQYADDPTALNGLHNPERGFRLECPLALGEGQLLVERADGRIIRKKAPSNSDEKALPFLGLDISKTGYSDRTLAAALKTWDGKGITSFLGLVWLDEYVSKPLDPAFLKRLDASLETFRRAGLKLQLRFAYELDDSKTAGPDLPTIQGHWAQLKPILLKNTDVITALHLGSIGRRGEGPNAAKLPENSATHAAVLMAANNALPPGRPLLVQSHNMRESLLTELKWPYPLTQQTAYEAGNPSAHTGLTNANFLIDATHNGQFEAPIGAQNQDWRAMCFETLFVPYDAALSAKAASQALAADGWQVAQILTSEHGFTLGVNYGWSESDPTKTAGIVDGWKKQMKTQAEVAALGLTISDGYFTDAKGNAVSRSAYDYLRDHLGYRFELLSANWPSKVKIAARYDLKIRVSNRGMASCPTPRTLDLLYAESPTKYTMSSGDGEAFDIRKIPPVSALQDKEKGFEIMVRATVPNLSPGKYQLVVVFPESEAAKLHQDHHQMIRFANRDAPLWQSRDQKYQGAVLGEIDVTR
jgi:hypothetical protein